MTEPGGLRLAQSRPLARAEAERLASLIEEGDPAPLSISLVEADEERDLWTVEALFEADESLRTGRELAEFGLDLVHLSQRDWVAELQAGLAPVVAGRFFLHGSHDRARRPGGAIAIEIEAATAFGTGHHSSTRGCLLALDTLLKQRRPVRVLDVGTGSGVLAIATARATRLPVLASDIDPEAVRVAALNAKLNGVRDLVRCRVAEGLADPAIGSGVPYDLVFANILARPLIGLAAGMARITGAGGQVVLSGLTRAQERSVFAAYLGRGFSLEKRFRLGNWTTMLLSKRKTPGAEPRRASRSLAV